MAALLLVVIVPAMAPARAMPCERIHPFHFVPLFRKHYTRLMAREFRLLLLLDLAQRRAEAHSREVKRAHGEWLRARGRQVQLADLRDLRVRDLAGQMRSGLTGECLRERARLLQMQAADLADAQRNIESAHRNWQAKLALWLQAQQRVKALKVLEQRHQGRLAVQERRVTQRQHDELVQSSRYWRRDSQGPT